MTDPAVLAAASHDHDSQLPMFDVQKVQLRFDISAEFVAAAVANNVLVLALSTGRILRFDLDNAEEIDDIDLPKRPAEVGVIRKLFLDPSASHLIIATTAGESFYLHMQSRTPKQLARLRAVVVECVAWNPARPTASTREILVGSSDGNVYEMALEPTTEFYRSTDKYLRNVWNGGDGAIAGIYADIVASRPETRRVLVATQHKLWHFVGPTAGRHHGPEVYAKLFEAEAPSVHELQAAAAAAAPALVTSPDVLDASAEDVDSPRAYAWLHSHGIFHGNLLTASPDLVTLGKQVFRESNHLPQSKLSSPVQAAASGRARITQQPPISSLLLTQFHMLALVEGRLTAINRWDETIVYHERILDPAQPSLGLLTDHAKNTYWLFTPQDIFEIVVTDEARDIWRIMLKSGRYETAQRYAQTPEQKDAVAAMTGDHLMSQGKFTEAAAVLGKSAKAFEDVALTFIDKGEHHALRTYLSVKLSTLKKTARMQRIMLASWMVELYMANLNQLDDHISTRAELSPHDTATDPHTQLPLVRQEFQDFVTKHKSDLDRKATYEIIAAHGREEELLFFANMVDDADYVLSYWANRERWREAIAVLKKQTDPDIFYRYSTVLMSQSTVAAELVEVLMRQSGLDAKKIIPALLTYNRIVSDVVSIDSNQAIRYLQFCINHSHTTEPAVHNTLISMYAAHPATEEKQLLQYLQTQAQNHEQHYDADFALRLCIAHKRVRSAVHVYGTMGQYASAVDLALKYDQVDLAADVADRPGNDHVLKKKLWLKVAKKVIGRETSIKAALDFLKRCEPHLRIEDLIPFFPDFVIIDDFKEEICAALEDYSRQIDDLKREMDDSAQTSQHIKDDIAALDRRYAIVEPGERCWKCRLPLLMRQFFVFPCQHAFHADCLGAMVMNLAGVGKGQRIRELQGEVGRGVAVSQRRQGMVRELDALVAGACVLCSELAVKQIDQPFITAADDPREWAV